MRMLDLQGHGGRGGKGSPEKCGEPAGVERAEDRGAALRPKSARTGRRMTQKEVADLMGISQSYISRLEKKIMMRLKKEIVKFE